MRRGPARWLLAAAFAAALAARPGGPTPAHADEAWDTEVEVYLCDRDPEPLRRALAAEGRGPGDSLVDLVDLAAQPHVPPATPGRAPPEPAGAAPPEGLAAVVAGVRALRALDLSAARRLAQGADPGAGVAGAWLVALLRARSGDGAGAQARLMAPPGVRTPGDALPLALLGAALPEEDRALLVVSARRAVARAAQRERVGVLEHLGLGAAALDPRLGREVLALCVRALRRLGAVAEARALLGRVGACGAGLDLPELALEAALLEWTEGRPAQAAAALGVAAPPAGGRDLFLLLSRAQGPPRAPLRVPPLAHAPGTERAVELVARWAEALGVALDRAAVRAEAAAAGQDPAHPARVRALFEARDCEVLALGGDVRGTDALLAAQVPFLRYQITRDGARYVDLPLLVRHFDRDTGLWRLDEPDVERPDALPRASAAKSWALVVVPRARAALLAPLRGGAAEALGREVEALRAEAGPGAPRPPAEAAGALASLYRGWIAYERARRDQDPDALAVAAAHLEHSRRVPPLLGFEEYARAQRRAARGEIAAALAGYARCALLEGESAELALARYAGLGRHARDQVDEARRALDDAVRRAPDDVRVLAARAVLFRALGEPGRARADLLRARDVRPDSIDLALMLAELCLEEDDLEAALAVLDDARRQGPAVADDERLRALRRRVEAERLARADDLEALREHRRSPEPQTRQRLAFELAARGDAAAESVLRKLLFDPAPAVRVTVLRLYLHPRLRERAEQDELLLRRLVSVLERDPSEAVRAAAAALLARVERPLARVALAQAAAGARPDPAPGVREAALGGLALVDRPVARSALVAALEDPEASVRRAAIEGLFRFASTRRGYDPDQPAPGRAAALAAWQEWLAAGE